MSGCTWEYVAGYINSPEASKNGESVVKAPAKHKDIYSVGSSNSRGDNYKAAAGKYGDAVYEVSKESGESYSWYYDCSYFPHLEYAWFGRGGNYDEKLMAGMFCFDYTGGGNYSGDGFRIALTIVN